MIEKIVQCLWIPLWIWTCARLSVLVPYETGVIVAFAPTTSTSKSFAKIRALMSLSLASVVSVSLNVLSIHLQKTSKFFHQVVNRVFRGVGVQYQKLRLLHTYSFQTSSTCLCLLDDLAHARRPLFPGGTLSNRRGLAGKEVLW